MSLGNFFKRIIFGGSSAIESDQLIEEVRWNKMRDPLGGIRGDEIKKSNPFAIDKMNALKELNVSIDWFEGRKRKSDKSILQQMRDGTWGTEEKIPNWEPSENSEFNGFDVILRWAGKEITRVRDVSKKEAKVALSGLKAFIRNINPDAPDFTNPWIVKCYNVTAYFADLKPVVFDASDDTNEHPHLFAGIKGEDSSKAKNRFFKDIQRTITFVDKALEFLEFVELPLRKRPPSARITSTKICKPTYKTSSSHFDVSLLFANQIILTEKNIPVPRAKIALASMRGWLRSIDYEKPDLEDETVKKCYEATKSRTKPGLYFKVAPEMLAIDEGGTSFWSKKLHCWVTGHFDSKGKFHPPDWSQ